MLVSLFSARPGQQLALHFSIRLGGKVSKYLRLPRVLLAMLSMTGTSKSHVPNVPPLSYKGSPGFLMTTEDSKSLAYSSILLQIYLTTSILVIFLLSIGMYLLKVTMVIDSYLVSSTPYLLVLLLIDLRFYGNLIVLAVRCLPTFKLQVPPPKHPLNSTSNSIRSNINPFAQLLQLQLLLLDVSHKPLPPTYLTPAQSIYASACTCSSLAVRSISSGAIPHFHRHAGAQPKLVGSCPFCAASYW